MEAAAEVARRPRAGLFYCCGVPSEEVFEDFVDEAEQQDIHDLRETACTDYIWTLYEPWDIRDWVQNP